MKPPGRSVTQLVRNPRLGVLMMAGILGWAGGVGAKRWSGAPPAPPAESGGIPAETPRNRPHQPAATASPAALAEVANLRSTDTPDDLMALGDRELYGRLALWLLDATTADLAGFWTAYQAKQEPEIWVADLLFARWTRLDPDDALRAAGKDHQHQVWWAWAINDPATAVARVAGLGPDLMGSVLRAIGQFHPELLDQVMAAHPEYVTGGAIEGVAKGLFRDDPAAALDFLRQHGQGYDTKLLREWAHDDPKAAFAWVRNQLGGYQTASQLNTVIDTLERENPALLRELASEQPPGKLRRQLDAAIFRNLLETDPAAALAQARATESPRLAAERLAEAARRMVAKDPDHAFALLSELLEKCPTAFNHQTWTRYPTGGSGGGGALAGVNDLGSALVGIDPRRALEAVETRMTAMGGNAWESWEGPATALAAQWAQRDLEGFCGWLDEQPPGEAQTAGTRMVVGQLTERQAFQEAAQRAAKVADESLRNNLVSTIARSWVGHDRAAAVAWFEQLELPDEVRQNIGRNIGLESREGQP
jgi:hypothetical protein